MKYIMLLLGLVLALTPGCDRSTVYVLSGQTMGTVYHITLVSVKNPGYRDLAEKIEARLDEINTSMSLFDEESELSRFNAAPRGEAFCVSDDFFQIFTMGGNLHSITHGAWDGSVGPLVNVWGFGHDPKTEHIPDQETIQTARKRTGYEKIHVTGEYCLVKTAEGLVLDFGSIAKGYAVDAIADLFRENGFNDFLVEIGGEVRTSGLKKGKPWIVGINTPAPDASLDQVLTAIKLRDKAIATSGDYRNFRVEKGTQYTHVIDPATGSPVRNHVASVSVIADRAAYADGLATALMVMGKDKGLEEIGAMHAECLFILRADDGKYTLAASPGWPGKIK